MRANGYAIRALRERSGFSQTKFAEACGIHRTHLSNIEHLARHPSPALLKRMAEVLDVPVMALITGIAPEEVA